MPFPFEADFAEIHGNLDCYVDAVFGSLESEFLVMPKGPGFVEFPVFEQSYETLKRGTRGFEEVTPATVLPVVYETPVALIVLRCILGLTPPEWAYLASDHTGTHIGQGAVRTLDRNIRMNPDKPLRASRLGLADQRIEALIATACVILQQGAPTVAPDRLHRMGKADTGSGLVGVRSMADLGAPYSMLLYERFLGRPFAGHRDSISELVGDLVENAIEDVLARAGISFRKTRRAERLPGFDQAPDFVIPNEFNPRVTIEAKLTEDDGTARDKVTRVQHLAELSMAGQPPDQPRFEVIACIAGRGFGVRREDMRKLILATRGKVFTLQNMDRLVDATGLREFRSR